MASTVDEVRAEMGAIEQLIKGLPGIREYVDNDLRRTTDKRLRNQIADYLRIQRTRLVQHQKQLLENSGLKWMTTIESQIQRLQTTIDRILSASQGYAGYFSAVRIRERELEALYNFDQSFAQDAAAIGQRIDQLMAVHEPAQIAEALAAVEQAITMLGARFAQRLAAIENPDAPADAMSNDTAGNFTQS